MAAAAAAAVAAPAAAERSGSSRSDCTDCSHCAGRSAARRRAGVRVSVNLGHFFTDQRARAFMWAPHGRCVQWLGRRVARVFGLPDDIALMSRGHMLPVNEPLLMLGRDDPVEVVNMSYVFTAHDPTNDPNSSSQRTATEAGAVGRSARPAAGGAGATAKQDNGGQLPTSSQGDGATDAQETPAVTSAGDAEGAEGEGEGDASDDEGEELRRLKRHALRLLEERCGGAGADATGAKRARRRRRRRRAAPAPAASDEEEPCAAQEGEGEGAVLRNGPGSRPPRLVRALSPPAPAQLLQCAR